MDFPRCYVLLLVIHVAHLIVLHVEGFTVQSPDYRENRALRRHDYQLSDFRHEALYTGAKETTKVNILQGNLGNKCKNGVRSSTNCTITETRNEEIDTVDINKNRDDARLKDNHITSDNVQFPNQKIHKNLYEFANRKVVLSEQKAKKIESAAMTGTKNCTDLLLANSTTNLDTNTTKTIKMIPMLDAFRKMLIALDNLLALAINSSVDNSKTNSNKTESNVTNISPKEEEAKTQPPVVIIAPKAYKIKGNSDIPLTSDVEAKVEIKENEETISSTSDLIDEAIEDLVKTEMVTTFGEQLKSSRVDSESKKLISTIEETENTRLYKWCVRLIRGEKPGDKKKLKSQLKSKEMKKAFKSLHTDKPEFKTKSKPNDEVNITIFINSVLDCIGFVNTMQNIYHPRK